MKWKGHGSVLAEPLQKRDHLKDLQINGEISLKWISEIGWEGVDWINPAQDKTY
jgi:hypothetical protein